MLEGQLHVLQDTLSSFVVDSEKRHTKLLEMHRNRKVPEETAPSKPAVPEETVPEEPAAVPTKEEDAPLQAIPLA